MFFFLSARFQQLNTAQKLSIFKFLFLFYLVDTFYSLSLPFPAWPLFLIVLYNGVKKDSGDKGVTCDAYQNGELFMLISKLSKRHPTWNFESNVFTKIRMSISTWTFLCSLAHVFSASVNSNLWNEQRAVSSLFFF